MKIKKSKYSYQSEHHVDPLSVQEEITEAKQVYAKFTKKYLHKLDLGNPESIHQAYEEAKRVGIFRKAESIRNLLYEKDIHFYGVIYTSDFCANSCAYCPGGEENRKCAIANGIVYPRKILKMEQIIQETLTVLKNGHSHICYLEGSPAKGAILNGNYAKRIAKIISEVIKQTAKEGLEEIILNIEPLTEDGFKEVAQTAQKANEEVGADVALQFRVFQETYNETVYAQMHPQNEAGSRPKADYWNRYHSQARALRGGVDSIGLGALLGLNQYPIEEIEGLVKHIKTLQKKFIGIFPARVCLPSANELHNLKTQIPFILKTGQARAKNEGESLGKFILGDYEKLNELIYALARLAMPEVNIVSSERDTPEMLQVLNKYATCTTLGVQAGVGENCNIPLDQMTSSEELKHYMNSTSRKATFCQATTFPRNVEETLQQMHKDGYNPIFGK